MSEEQLSIDRILELWKADCGEEKCSDRGSTYLVVPIADRRGHLLNLIQAMVDYGHSEEDIRSGTTSTKVVKTCWSDLITKMTAKELKRSRDITRQQWEAALDEFFVSNFPRYRGIKKILGTKSSNPILEPTDRIKMDTSDMPEIPMEEGLLSELAAIGSFVDGKNE